MARYKPVLLKEFRIKGLPAIKDPDTGVEQAFEDVEIWGEGVIPGDADMRIRSASQEVEVLPGGRTKETINPPTFMYLLYHEWFGLKGGWNLEEEVKTDRVDPKSGDPIMEWRALERNGVSIDTKLAPQHRQHLQLTLAQHFYPEYFGGQDPNSSPNGKNGTDGPKDGSEPGSSESSPSPAPRSPSRGSSEPSSTGD